MLLAKSVLAELAIFDGRLCSRKRLGEKIEESMLPLTSIKIVDSEMVSNMAGVIITGACGKVPAQVMIMS